MDENQDRPDSVLAEFEHEEGQITIHLIGDPRELVLEVDGEVFTRRELPAKYSDDVVASVIEHEAELWVEQEQPLDEIEYNLEQIEYKLKKWPYG